MSFYPGLRATAAALLTDKGQRMTLTQRTQGAYDPATGGSTVTETEHTVTGAVFDFPAALIDGTLIQQGDKKAPAKKATTAKKSGSTGKKATGGKATSEGKTDAPAEKPAEADSEAQATQVAETPENAPSGPESGAEQADDGMGGL